MEQIRIKRIDGAQSNDNLNTTQVYLVIEIEPKPSDEWNAAFDQNAVVTKQKAFDTATCSENMIYVKYKKAANRDTVFSQIEALVNETNQEENDFNSWIDKTNARLAGGK
jgi:restriction endonuclease